MAVTTKSERKLFFFAFQKAILIPYFSYSNFYILEYFKKACVNKCIAKFEQSDNAKYFQCIIIQVATRLFYSLILWISITIANEVIPPIEFILRLQYYQLYRSVMAAQLISWFKDRFLASPTCTSLTIYLIYYAYICVASLVLPAKVVNGHPNPKRGPQLQYSINGFKLTCLTIILMLVFGGVVPQFDKLTVFRMSILADEFWPLLTTVNIVALIVSTLLYIKGKIGKSFLGEFVDKHSHGSFGLDFWVGREINPRIGKFDIKFCAYRVGMLWWLVLNFGFLAKQVETEGTTSIRMLCYQFMTGFYVLDYFWNQQKMLTTWDIISEEFGHMLVFGDYVFIPFAFTVQCHYLLNYPDFSTFVSPAIIITLFFIGFFIFRTANSQKNQYKTNPTQPIWGKAPELVGGKLLVSGFWGYGRHMNYTGDLIMAVSYCLPCGPQLGGYFYAIYLFTLLLHRAYRDDTKCRQKYGQLWKDYCKRVPNVYIPFNPIDSILTSIGRLLYSLTNKQDLEKNKSN